MNDSPDVIIKVEDLSKTYELGKTQVKALCGVSFEIQRGELMAIMGPSGSGKSTLMNLIGCLDTPTGGRYTLNGKLASAMTENELALVRNREIGFVFQVFNLLPRATAFRNVELPLIYKGTKKKEREEKVRAALAMVDMSGRMTHRPPELSGGERQRVAIARALVNEPSLLLADEPTGNLDSKTGQEILNLFHKLHAKGHTIILVTHDRDVAAQTERILFLRDGMLERDERKGA
ncbi:MAG: ABC transporter ATP-binding protein [Candidatus Aminicenantes bacterium]|nr:ABC transporter ATP-binding protein [Candidatus Aminicenantes bacterium]